ncbi:glycosyltransferase family 2 protein [Planococcus salinarum]|uniref:glycosyltransferase family 2 protein n=1 Tax=Planococcus salinarum TaxID=622695 RepID=UPI000E3E7F56|nr:glycosyltransferase [Planococcus salinarum]TAA72820.1 glycosyltransferase [Planococcus salinarum]
MTDKITVIIPVFNVEDYLTKCVESVLNQTYKNLEILLINDGSTDSSGSLCDLFELTDSRIRVIHKQNGGLSDARNAGLDAATGEFIAFLDSDDWVDPEMYEVLHDLLILHDADISICRFKNIYNHMIEDGSTGKIAVYDNVGAIKAIAKIENNFFPTHNVWNKLFKSELVKKFRFIKGKIVEDLYFTPRVIQASKKCVYIDKAMHNYLRERPDSIMNAPINLKRIQDELTGFDEFARLLEELRLPEHSLFIKETYLRKLIEFHYHVKNSKAENKDAILKMLEDTFCSNPYRNSKASMGTAIRWKITLFELSPLCSFYARNVVKNVKALRKKNPQKPVIKF